MWLPGSPSRLRPALERSHPLTSCELLPCELCLSPGHPEATTSVHHELVSLLPPHSAMNIPTFFLPFHWGEGDSWTPSRPGPHLPNLPPLELAELPTRRLCAWIGERHISQSCHLPSPSAQHTNMVIFPTKHPAKGPGEQPLWGEEGTGRGLGARLADSPSLCCCGIIGGG